MFLTSCLSNWVFSQKNYKRDVIMIRMQSQVYVLLLAHNYGCMYGRIWMHVLAYNYECMYEFVYASVCHTVYCVSVYLCI